MATSTVSFTRKVLTSGNGRPAVADLNGDKHLDLVTGSHRGSFDVMLGVGDGTFGAPTNYPTGDAPTMLAIADFNGDQQPDLAIAADTRVDIYLNQGGGVFTAAATQPAPVSASSIAAADLDGDGNIDLAIAGPVPHLLMGQGDGTFTTGTLGGADVGDLVAIADLDGDQEQDLIVTKSVGQLAEVDVWLGKSGFASGPAVFPVTVDSTSIAVGDFNGDGKLDIATSTNAFGAPEDVTSILLGVGDGTFQPKVDFCLPASTLIAADLNGDGVTDLALTVTINGGQRAGTAVFFGARGSTFPSEDPFVATLESSQLAAASAAGDFNGDGKIDLVDGYLQGTDAIVFLNTTP